MLVGIFLMPLSTRYSTRGSRFTFLLEKELTFCEYAAIRSEVLDEIFKCSNHQTRFTPQILTSCSFPESDSRWSSSEPIALKVWILGSLRKDWKRSDHHIPTSLSLFSFPVIRNICSEEGRKSWRNFQRNEIWNQKGIA